MNEEAMAIFLRDHLNIQVNTTSEYCGGNMGDGRNFRDRHTIQLLLDDEVISEATL